MRSPAGSAELQDFLQRVGGYSLTGSVKEHALFFFYGTGGNGKGVLLNTMTAILADYAAVAPMETFVVTQGERHPTDLAGLRGARLVTAQKTERGQRWAESKVKALTGGDPISARFMRQAHQRRRSEPAAYSPCPLYGYHYRARSGIAGEAPRGTAGHPGMDDRGLPKLARERVKPARICAGGHPDLLERGRQYRAMDRRMLHHRKGAVGHRGPSMGKLESLGGRQQRAPGVLERRSPRRWRRLAIFRKKASRSGAIRE